MQTAIDTETPLPAAPPASPLPFHALPQDHPVPHPDADGPAPRRGRRRLVLNIPHAVTAIPPEVRGTLLLDDAALAEALRVMTDWFTDRLFPVTPWEAERIVASVSRLVVDIERFPDDRDEAMAACGMGAVYLRTYQGRRLRRAPGEAERRALMERYYWPHHDALTYATGRVRQAFGSAVIVDCHSFSSQPLPHEPDQRRPRPDLCIGTDRQNTPPALARALSQAARAEGLTVAIDEPFAGSIVPPAFAGDKQVVSVMIEVNRRLYLDEATAQPGADFAAVQAIIGRLLAVAAAWG